MKTIDFSYFIERYNAGEMNEAEKQWFRKELEGNEKLRQEVDLRRKTDAVLKNQDLINLRNKLNMIEKKRESDVPAKRPVKPVNMKYAAAIVGLAILGGVTLFSGRNFSNDEILNRFYKPYETTTSSRSDLAVINSDYNTALDYYKIHDFRNAAIYFSKALENEPGNMQSALLNGISNFEINNYPEAKHSFVKVIDDNKNLFINHAQWYLALCYIKTDELVKAREQLAVIEKSRSIYKNDAKKILRKLK
jgi:tetratricopeptide (TPR) repeat protein